MPASASFLQSPSDESLWPHRLAVLTACATFPLLFIGGLVTSKAAGLAVPDWPTTFGYNMFFYPWSKMVGNVFYEHGHRLVASAVGLLTIVLALVFWFKEKRTWLRWLGVVALGLVIAQGVLGGLRVLLLQQTLAVIHASLAQAFFAFMVSLAVFTSTSWRAEYQEKPLTDGGRLWRLGAVTTAIIYAQVVFGAVLRHSGERLDAHLLFAGLVVVHVFLVVMRVLRFHSHRAALVRPIRWLAILLVLQLALGFGSYLAKFTILLKLPVEGVVYLTTIHLLTGALMLVTSLLFTLRAIHLSVFSKPVAERKILTEQFSL